MSKVEIENVLQPGKTHRIDAEKFAEIRRAVMRILPDAPPGLTPKDIVAAIKSDLDQRLFPGGDKAGWWVKAVQLDCEAKGTLIRSQSRPVRLWRN